MKYSLSDGNLKINEKLIDTGFRVAEAVEIENVVIVRLENPNGLVGGENILAFCNDGSLHWRVQRSPHGNDLDSPYLSIDLDESHRVVAQNSNGVLYEIDKNTGSVVAINFQRFW